MPLQGTGQGLRAVPPVKTRHLLGLIRYNDAMIAARPFALNTASAATAGVAVRATTIKTTTIKG